MSLLLTATLPACTTGRSQSDQDGATRMVWPQPPDPPRIELLSTFGTASELGIAPSFWSRLAVLVSGGGQASLVRPTGVSAVGGRIAVADPGAGIVHLYDTIRERALQLRACGETTLVQPVAVALTADRLYVADADLGRVFAFDQEGKCLSGWPLEPGSRPAGLAVDAARSRIYVAEAGAHRVVAMNAHGDRVMELGSRGDGPGQFNYPTWLAVDGEGNLYVTDALNFRVQIFDADGRVTGSFGEQGDGSGFLSRPKGIGVDRDGHVYLVDALFDAVQIFDRQGQYLMVFGSGGRDAGHFWLPSGLAIDGDRIYVCDSYNQRVQVFRYLGGTP